MVKLWKLGPQEMSLRTESSASHSNFTKIGTPINLQSEKEMLFEKYRNFVLVPKGTSSFDHAKETNTSGF